MKFLKHVSVLLIAIMVSFTILCVGSYVSKVVQIDFKAENPPEDESYNGPPGPNRPAEGQPPEIPPGENDRPDKRFTNETEPEKGKNISEWAVKKVETTYDWKKLMGKDLTRKDGMEILAYIYMRVHWNFGADIEDVAKDIRHSVKNNMGYDDYDVSGDISRMEYLRAVQYIFSDDYIRAEAEMDTYNEGSIYMSFDDVSDDALQHDLKVMRKLAWIEGYPGNVIKITDNAKYDDLKVVENCLKSPGHKKLPLLKRLLTLVLSVLDKASFLSIVLFFVGEIVHYFTGNRKQKKMINSTAQAGRRRYSS